MRHTPADRVSASLEVSRRVEKAVMRLLGLPGTATGSSLLTVEGEQHTVVAAGTNACVADSTPASLVALRTPPADALRPLTDEPARTRRRRTR